MAIFTSIAALVTAGATAIGFSAVTAAAIGATAVQLALSAAASFIFGGGRNTSTTPSASKQQIQATINQSAGPRTRLYGQGLLGGTRAFWETDGNKLYQIIIANHTPLSNRLNYWIDGLPVVVNGSGFVTSDPFGGNDISLDYADGGTVGGDWPDVTAVFPTLWTAAHQLTDQATVKAVFTAPDATSYNKKFPRGPNSSVQIEAQGAAVFDYRTSNTAYTDNAALCIADFLTHPDGFRIDQSRIDEDLFSDFADLCDESVALRFGGSEPRYRIWGVYELSEDPKNVLARMSLACDASIYQTAEGKVGIIGGRYSVPDVTITDDDIYSLERVEGDGAIDGFNVIKGTYTSADHDYQDTEAEAWENTTALLTQPEKSEDMRADMVPSHGQMRRLMKLQINQRNRAWTGSIVTSLVGLKARFPKGDGVHTIRVQYEDLGMDEVVEVMGHEVVAEKSADGAIKWKCAIQIASIDSSWFDWDELTEEGTAPAEPERAAVQGTPTPVIASLVEDVGPIAVVTVTDISRPDLELDAEIRAVGASNFSSMLETDLRAESGVLVAATNYEVRVRYKGGSWSANQPISIT